MTNFSLVENTRLSLNGEALVVLQQQGQLFVLRNVTSHALVVKRGSELRKAYASGHMEIVDLLAPLKEDVQGIKEPLQRLLSDYSARQREEVRIKVEYLRAICPRGPVQFRRAKLPEAIKRVWLELDSKSRGPKPPAVSTIYAWRRQWMDGAFGVARLVNCYDLRGRRPKAVDERVVPILERAVHEYYATPSRLPISEVHKLAMAMVNRQNQVRAPDDQLPAVTRRDIVRQIEGLDRYEVIRARYGVATARAATRVFGERTETLRPLQRVEADHTPLDVLVVSDDEKSTLGRPYATVLIDVATRMILSMWISFRAPNADSVLRALKEAVLPKDQLLKTHGVKGEWPVWGLPEVLVVDNGREFHSQALEEALKDLGISIVYCPPRQPFYKGTVERFLKELNYGCVHHLPGTTFSKLGLRGDYRSEQHAVLTLKELRRFVIKWVVEEYAMHFHRGIAASPLQRWNELVDPKALHLPARLDMLDVALSPAETRKLTAKGIEINGLRYVAEELRELRLRHGNITLSVRPNHDDLGSVQVLNPTTEQYFIACCTRQDYAAGVSLEQHQYLDRRAREAYAALPHMDALLAAKLERREATDRIIASRKVPAAEVDSPKAKAPKPSGRDLQACHEFVEQQHEAAQRNVTPPPVQKVKIDSFDDIEAFPTGQVVLF